MAIPFNPPEGLINAYLNRPQPAEIANQGIQQALQTYAKMKQDEEAQQQTAFGSYLKLLETDPELAKTPIGQKLSKKIGGGLGSYTPPGASTPAPQQTPDIAQDANFNSATQGPGVVSTDGQFQSSVLNHLQSIGHPMAQLPGPTQVPQMVTGRGKLGDKINAQNKTSLEMTKLVQGVDANEPASFDEVKTTFEAAGKPALGEELIKNAQALGQNVVQRKSVDAAIKGLGVAAQSGRGTYFQNQAELNQAKFQNELNQQANRALNPNVAGGALKPQQERLNRIGRAEALVQQMATQKGSGDTRQMQELATSLASVLTGGNVVAQQQIEELVPQTYKGNINKFLEKLTSNPTGLEQQAFVTRLADTLKREKGTINTQIKGAQTAALPALEVMKHRNPTGYKNIVDANLNNPQYQTTPTVSSQEEYDTLPSGSDYLSPDGRLHRKK